MHHGMWMYSASGGGISSGMCGQARLQRSQCAAAVADAVFEFGRHLRGGLLEQRIPEYRIVTETVFAQGRIEDFTMPDAFGNHRLRILSMREQHDAAVKACGSQGIILCCHFG